MRPVTLADAVRYIHRHDAALGYRPTALAFKQAEFDALLEEMRAIEALVEPEWPRPRLTEVRLLGVICGVDERLPEVTHAVEE